MYPTNPLDEVVGVAETHGRASDDLWGVTLVASSKSISRCDALQLSLRIFMEKLSNARSIAGV